MIDYYDKVGNSITMEEWSNRFPDRAYRRVAETTLPDGTWISTVWLGLNHQFGDGPPLIFETMAFSTRENLNELDCQRYSTLADAEAGHTAMVCKWAVERKELAP